MIWIALNLLAKVEILNQLLSNKEAFFNFFTLFAISQLDI